MNKLLACIAILWFGASVFADDIIKPSKDDVPENYVTVSLDAYANDLKEQTFPGKQITVKNIPFNLVKNSDVDNLFLKSAGWSDWKIDSGSYESAYDMKPKEKAPNRPILQIPVAASSPQVNTCALPVRLGLTARLKSLSCGKT